MCFLNLEPRKHIALHQIHKIMFFLATSYDPFKTLIFAKHILLHTILTNKQYTVAVSSMLVFRSESRVYQQNDFLKAGGRLCFSQSAILA